MARIHPSLWCLGFSKAALASAVGDFGMSSRGMGRGERRVDRTSQNWSVVWKESPVPRITRTGGHLTTTRRAMMISLV